MSYLFKTLMFAMVVCIIAVPLGYIGGVLFDITDMGFWETVGAELMAMFIFTFAYEMDK